MENTEIKKNTMLASNRRITSSEQNLRPKTISLRCLFKQQSLGASFTVPLRLAPHWNRVFCFGNANKFKADDLFQVNLTFVILTPIHFSNFARNEKKNVILFLDISSLYLN